MSAGGKESPLSVAARVSRLKKTCMEMFSLESDRVCLTKAEPPFQAPSGEADALSPERGWRLLVPIADPRAARACGR